MSNRQVIGTPSSTWKLSVANSCNRNDSYLFPCTLFKLRSAFWMPTFVVCRPFCIISIRLGPKIDFWLGFRDRSSVGVSLNFSLIICVLSSATWLRTTVCGSKSVFMWSTALKIFSLKICESRWSGDYSDSFSYEASYRGDLYASSVFLLFDGWKVGM